MVYTNVFAMLVRDKPYSINEQTNRRPTMLSLASQPMATRNLFLALCPVCTAWPLLPIYCWAM